MSKQWVRTVTQDPDTGDYVVDLGDEICQAAGWQEGDVLEWIDQGDGSWVLRKAKPPILTRIKQWLLHLVNKIRQ